MTAQEAAVANAEGYGMVVAYWLPRLWAFAPEYLDDAIVATARMAANAAHRAFPELRA